jgi:hypothetical protein
VVDAAEERNILTTKMTITAEVAGVGEIETEKIVVIEEHEEIVDMTEIATGIGIEIVTETATEIETRIEIGRGTGIRTEIEIEATTVVEMIMFLMIVEINGTLLQMVIVQCQWDRLVSMYKGMKRIKNREISKSTLTDPCPLRICIYLTWKDSYYLPYLVVRGLFNVT